MTTFTTAELKAYWQALTTEEPKYDHTSRQVRLDLPGTAKRTGTAGPNTSTDLRRHWAAQSHRGTTGQDDNGSGHGSTGGI